MARRPLHLARAARLAPLLVAVAGSVAAHAAEPPAGRPGAATTRRVNPPGLSQARGFTHVVVAEAGRTVFVSGQVAYDAKGEVVGHGDLRAQAKQVYENLKVALAAAGATFADVVKSNAYVVGLNRDALAALREVRSAYLPPQDPPASTVVGVAALANPDCLVEIEVTAVVR